MRNSDNRFYAVIAVVMMTAVAGLSVTLWLDRSPQPTATEFEAASSGRRTNTEEIAAFPSLQGPTQATSIPSMPPRTTIVGYRENSRNSMAILLKDTSASWLGLAHGLKSIGLPFKITTDANEALAHQVVLIYPAATGANTTDLERQAFYTHVQEGKTLIAFSVIAGGLSELFGFRSSSERNDLSGMRFLPSPLTEQITADRDEAEIPLSSSRTNGNYYPGVSFDGAINNPLAVYYDGSAAIVQNTYESAAGPGRAIAIGIDFGHYILRAQNGRFVQFADAYANTYQPKLDSLLRFLAAIYQAGEPNAVLVSPTAFNKSFTALLTHDVDYTRSIHNATTYAEFEAAAQVPATYFIQTKYVTDYNDSLFFEGSVIPLLNSLRDLGGEIASHSVAHSNEFSAMEIGDGREQYPGYRPFVQDFSTVRNASIGGELRVSKFLLESILQLEVSAFRPGHLSLPESLPQMLQATGYQYSSSITANEALTHLPYRSNFNRSYDTELPIFEFPVTIEDEEGTLGERIDESIALSESISRFGGLVNLLIHTDITGHKLEFEKQYVDRFKDSAWFSSVGEFGDWWKTRDSVRLEFNAQEGEVELQLHADDSIAGLTLQVPQQWQLERGPAGSRQIADKILVGEFMHNTTLIFNRNN